MLFKAQNFIFAAISLPAILKKDSTVILTSLTREKAVFPAKSVIKSMGMKNESFYLTFGMT
jgi:hypothetical protein